MLCATLLLFIRKCLNMTLATVPLGEPHLQDMQVFALLLWQPFKVVLMVFKAKELSCCEIP